MSPHYSDNWLTVYEGDAATVLSGLDASSVHCVVTSPPYWGLRDYGTATWSGGDEDCDHIASPGAGREGRETPGGRGGSFPHNDVPHKAACRKCGATRIDSQLGLEATPEEYVANLVAVFREVKRVLRDDGTLWLNLGDSYASSGVGSWGTSGKSTLTTGSRNGAWAPGKTVGTTPAKNPGLAQKQLVGIPWRVAFALQADGWYLRSDIIWAKPNPMPESVTDRPTKAHEYLFLLSKSPRYYFDSEAVRETATWGEWNSAKSFSPNGRMARDGVGVAGGEQWNGTGTHEDVNKSGRNLRSVWTIATRPYPGAHFAVFPPELPERCIKAGSSEHGVCPECGAPWGRQTARGVFAGQDPEAADWIRRSGVSLDDLRRLGKSGAMRFDEYRMHGATRLVGGDFDAVLAQRLYGLLHGWLGRCVAEACGTETTGWRPTCSCATQIGQSIAPATILDPFAGSGTVGLVANRLSRRAVLIDLNPAYLDQQMQRNAQTPMGLAL